MGRTVLVLGLAMLPILVVLGLLELATWRDRRRRAVVASQIALTDAITGELGAIVAPVVEKRLWGPWQIRIAAPLGRAATMSAVLAITQREMSHRVPGARSYRIVLTPQDEPPSRIPASRPAASARAA
jgi:hypothetical protein